MTCRCSSTGGRGRSGSPPRASDYLIGGTYEVPSGLGGTFRVILKDACDTFAIVQNCGNCEDFDAMQPYRVPLDALMEIDDQRAA